MKVSNKILLEDFIKKHNTAKKPLNRWLELIENNNFDNHNELKKIFASADYVGNGRYIFNIKGNDFRLVVLIIFVGGIAMVRFCGTHSEYDKLKTLKTFNIMKIQFENIETIKDKKTFDKVNVYLETLIKEATEKGFLNDQYADNAYTKEISRIGSMCADFESIHEKFEHLKVKNPLLISIEKEMQKRHLKQRQTAELLEVKENTFSQILNGKRSISMQMAKRLHRVLNIDAKTLIEYA